ncbi:MAG TPA: UrcA family protein [Rhizomicrobium sp.]|jgi:UrcA family protein
MAKKGTALFASAMIGAALLSGAGAAKAQGYGGYYDRIYRGDQPENVIVHPEDRVEKRQVLGHVDGEIDPVEYSISRPVNIADLDPSKDADSSQLRDRVAETARDLCAELDGRFPQLRGDRDADRECVRTATRNAMRDIRYRYG